MGLIADMLANAGFGGTAPVEALRRRGVREFNGIVARGDMVLSSAMTAIDEVQSLAVNVETTIGGTFTLTFLLQTAETFTTAAIAYNASAATVETAIDVAATAAAITSWTNGDITVAGGDLNTNPMTFTFDGASVTELNHAPITIDGALLVVDGVGAVSETTKGLVDQDEVQSLAIHVATVSGGTFTLAFTLASAETFLTANIAYDAAAATVETAIDVAATAAVIAGWTNGDITVAGGDLNTNPMTFTFDGTSVDNLDHDPIVVDGALLTGGGTAGAVSETTKGQVGTDEVQSLAVNTITTTGGTFTLTVLLSTAETFTTAAIAYNASAATVETAMDVAATAAAITSWTNGDITVAGGDLNTAAMTFTFDGTSVNELDHDPTTIDGALLTSDGQEGAVSATTEGQADRPGWDILTDLSIIAGTIPAEGVTPTGLVAGGNLPGSSLGLSNESIKMVAAYIADLENNPLTYDAILTAVGIS